MVEEIITIFCICDDYLKSVRHEDDKQARMKTSEILTTAIVGAKFFGRNYQKSRIFLASHGYINSMLILLRLISPKNLLFMLIVVTLTTHSKVISNFNDSSTSDLVERKMLNAKIRECVPKQEELSKLLSAQLLAIFLKKFMPSLLMVLSLRFSCSSSLIPSNLW